MPRKSTAVRKLKAKAGEAVWYATPEGRRRTDREFVRALKEGTLTRSPGLKLAKSDPRVLERLLEEARRNATRSISIRVPIADLEQAQEIAEKTGVGYQTVLKQAIREGLKRAGPRRLRSTPRRFIERGRAAIRWRHQNSPRTGWPDIETAKSAGR